jgi:dimethylargininase
MSQSMIALLRRPDPSIANCELTHLARSPIDFPALERQHRAYRDALAELAIETHFLPPMAGAADGVFVEDTAVVLDEIAIIAKPGVASRALETDSAREALLAWRERMHVIREGSLDGGDVLQIGKKIFVGLSTRTCAPAAAELKEVLSPFGYSVVPVRVGGCLHLKTAITFLGEGTVVANPDWVDLSNFSGLRVIPVHPQEPFAANALAANGHVLYSSDHPLTAERLGEAGFRLRLTSISQLAKAEAGLTCLSLVFKA